MHAATSPNTVELAELDFRYSNRAKFGIADAMHVDKAMKGIAGKQLICRRPNKEFR
jgi:hypothetical protein